MSNRIYQWPQPILPPGRDARLHKEKRTAAGDFAAILEQKEQALKFSHHAQQRIQARNIRVTVQELEKLQKALHRAESKGARESLILIDDVAFVVSVKNKTVITAIDGENLQDHIFTNIDSAVIVK
ncbi:MAG: TIGR02530 family flagellar biosynthesis protein [bacterium]